MIEKTQWEVVDEPQAGQRPSSSNFLNLLLGPYWKWKLLGGAIVVSIAVIIFAMLSGIVIFLGTIAAISAFVLAKLMHWLQPKDKDVQMGTVGKTTTPVEMPLEEFRRRSSMMNK